MSDTKLKWIPYKAGQLYPPDSDASSHELKFLQRTALYEAVVLGLGNTEPNGFPCVSDTHHDCNKSCFEQAIQKNSFVSVDVGLDLQSFQGKRNLRRLQNKLKFANKGR